MYDPFRWSAKRRRTFRRERGAVPAVPLVIPEPPRVLLLQQEEPFRARLADALSRHGFDASVAPDAPAALDWAAAAPGFDMAVVDLHLADAPVPAVVRALRESDPGLFVALLPGASAREDVAEGYRAGASAALRERSTPDEIARVLKTHLPQAGRRRRHAEERRKRWPRAVRRALALGAACLLLGAGLAAGVDGIFGLSDRPERPTDLLGEFLRRQGADRRMDRWLLIEQLRLAQESNDLTRRYYDAQIEHLGRDVTK